MEATNTTGELKKIRIIFSIMVPVCVYNFFILINTFSSGVPWHIASAATGFAGLAAMTTFVFLRFMKLHKIAKNDSR